MVDIGDMASVIIVLSQQENKSLRVKDYLYTLLLQTKSSNGQIPKHNSFQDYPAARAMH